jgi:hypothetical protein
MRHTTLNPDLSCLCFSVAANLGRRSPSGKFKEKTKRKPLPIRRLSVAARVKGDLRFCRDGSNRKAGA